MTASVGLSTVRVYMTASVSLSTVRVYMTASVSLSAVRVYMTASVSLSAVRVYMTASVAGVFGIRSQRFSVRDLKKIKIRKNYRNFPDLFSKREE
jgi:2-keto-3-deoxy-6-phosphogluconate aldolase